MITAPQLEALWARLEASQASGREFRSLRAPGTEALDVHVAIRTSDNAPCLLFDLAVLGTPATPFEAGGLRLVRIALEQGQAIALVLEDADRRDLFTTVSADLLNFARAASPGPALALVLERLEAWRGFLRSVGGGMSRAEVIGLAGELRVLEQLLEVHVSLLETWRAPVDGLHDFENRGHALEVKTTLGPGSRISISTLDQLDPTGLDRLDLIHVRLFESPDGQTLDELIESLFRKLPDDARRRELSNALLQRGLSPDDTPARQELRTAAQSMTAYPVNPQFPRLNRADLPDAIIDASYILDLNHLKVPAAATGSLIGEYGGRHA